MQARVLFVDDEPNILRGLQRTFRRMRQEWDMAFIEGGEAALKHLSNEPADVIVTDMRMPGLNGAQFLTEATKQNPRTIRIILSGEADREMTFGTVGVSHQFLPKPCNTDSLSNKIQQSLAARNRLSDSKLQMAVSEIASIPSPDRVFEQLCALLDSSAPLDEVSEIFASDPGLSAKILQLANSAYFGIGQRVNSPADAVKLLGVDIVRSLMEKGCFLKVSDSETLDADVFDHSLRDAQSVARLAHSLATAAGASEDEARLARVAGLLHNVGRLILSNQLPGSYAALHNGTEFDASALDRIEEQVFGCTHAAFGEYLALLWGLPEAVHTAIAQQASPQAPANTSDIVLLAVNTARRLHLHQAAGLESDSILEQLKETCAANPKLYDAAARLVTQVN